MLTDRQNKLEGISRTDRLHFQASLSPSRSCSFNVKVHFYSNAEGGDRPLAQCTCFVKVI